MLDLTDCKLAARALHSAIDSTPQEKIQALVARFRKLKKVFDSRVGAQTLVTVQIDSKSAYSDGCTDSHRLYFKVIEQA
jgi:hypothetical protein